MPTPRITLEEALKIELGPDYPAHFRRERLKPIRKPSFGPLLHTHHLNVRVSFDLREKFHAACHRNGVPYGEQIRRMMVNYVQNNPE